MNKLRTSTLLLLPLLTYFSEETALAEQGDVEVGVEVGAGAPVTGYLTPPGKHDDHARAGGLGWLNLGVGLSKSWSLDVLGGAGYLGEFAPSSVEPGSWVAQVSVGPKLRIGAEKRWWMSAHAGLYRFSGTQFGGDAGTGYDFGQGDEWRFGPLIRYQLTMGGVEDPHWPDDKRPDAALWLGFGLRHIHGHVHNKDLDGDGLVGSDDRCPQDAEDRDGFQDSDGCPDLDNDYDGIDDHRDKCPLEAEDIDGYEDADGCPDLDNDGDGIADTKDQCPLEAEDMDGHEDSDGCPDNDNDNDGVADAQDQCPGEIEDHDGYEDTDGCPDPDNDGDGVPDIEDDCPKAPGSKEAKGCPKAVRFDERTQSIEILETIEFQFNSAKLKDSAFPILEEVKALLAANPTIEKVRVEGHSDDRGQDDVNLKLSTARSAEVAKWLEDNGIESSRLSAFGCGEEYPIESNEKAAGRAKNRRVEFHVVGAGEVTHPDCRAAH